MDKLVAEIDRELRARARRLGLRPGFYLNVNHHSPNAWAADEWTSAMRLIALRLANHALADAVREVFHQRQRAAIRGQVRGALQ